MSTLKLLMCNNCKDITSAELLCSYGGVCPICGRKNDYTFLQEIKFTPKEEKKMKAKIEFDLPQMCCDCPMFEKAPTTENVFYFQGAPLNGKCRVLPIKNYEGRVIDYQNVSTREEIEANSRSRFCPLKEAEK